MSRQIDPERFLNRRCPEQGVAIGEIDNRLSRIDNRSDIFSSSIFREVINAGVERLVWDCFDDGGAMRR